MSSFLWLLYSATCLVSFFLSNVLDLEQYAADIMPSLYLFVIIYLWVKPFNNVKIPNYINNEDSNKELILSKILIVLLVPTFFYLLIYLCKIMTANVGNYATLRNSLDEQSLLPQTNITLYASFITHLYFLPIFLFFLSLYKKWEIKISVGLFLASLSFPLYSACMFGRDGIVFWGINAIFAYSQFRRLYEQNLRKIIERYMLMFGIMLTSVLVFITIQRFVSNLGEVSDPLKNVLEGTVGYFGQALGNFSDIFYFDPQNQGKMFPFFHDLLSKFGIESPDVSELLREKGLVDEIGVFGYFVKGLYFSYGKIGAILFSLIIFVFIYNIKIRFNKSNSLYHYFILLMLFQVPLDGIFYYRQGVNWGDLAYGICFFLLLFVYRVKQFK